MAIAGTLAVLVIFLLGRRLAGPAAGLVARYLAFASIVPRCPVLMSDWSKS